MGSFFAALHPTWTQPGSQHWRVEPWPISCCSTERIQRQTRFGPPNVGPVLSHQTSASWRIRQFVAWTSLVCDRADVSCWNKRTYCGFRPLFFTPCPSLEQPSRKAMTRHLNERLLLFSKVVKRHAWVVSVTTLVDLSLLSGCTGCLPISSSSWHLFWVPSPCHEHCPFPLSDKIIKGQVECHIGRYVMCADEHWTLKS